ncbi:CRISPR-associated helicase Cas3' [Saccharolobus solfataricus]
MSNLCISDLQRYCSHPDKQLKDHLREVGELAKQNAIESGRKDIADFAYIAGSLHDIGKYTKNFQIHLRGKKRVECSDHALVSSLIAYDEARTLISNRKDEFNDEISQQIYPLLTMIAVISHHGELKGLCTLKLTLQKKNEEIEIGDSCLSQQIDELKSKWDTIKSELTGTNLTLNTPSLNLLKEARKSIFNVENYLNNLVSNKNYTWKWYYEGLLLFSSLIDADKHSASNTQYLHVSSPLVDKLIDYANTLPKLGRVYQMRSQLFNFALNYSPRESILFLNSPTGSGKTISGSIIGLKHSKKRLIYSLPFINIIEQTYDVLSKVYGQDVLKYHHLTYPSNENEYTDMEKKLITAESWDSPIVVTTFEALVDTLFSPKNAYLKRLHNLANSFLILDEIQSMGIEELYIVKESLEEAVKQLNTNVLFMTATNPFWQGVRPVTATPNRYKVKVMLDDIVTPEKFVENINTQNDVMIEFNTIGSAEIGFNTLKQSLNKKIYYLSTRVIPKHRLKRVKDIAKKMGSGVVLVTTQLVEAGVDLDFTEAYRDLGPIDSIIQAAGRVSRNWLRDQGLLTVMRVKREGGLTDFAKIYGKLTEEITEETLRNFGKKEFNENDVDSLLNSYYSVLRQRFKPENSKKRNVILTNVTRLEFDKVKLKLIQEEPKYIVFIKYDDEAEKVYEELKAALKSQEFDKRAKVKKAMAKAENYIVKVWEQPSTLPIDENLEWYIVERDQVDEYYDNNTGFKNNNTNALIW